MVIEINDFTKEDVWRMREVIEDDEMVYAPEALSAFIDTPNTFGFTAKVNGKIAGFAYAYALVRPDKISPMLYLHSIGLLPGYQGQGLGTKLMEYVISFAKEKGFSECFVITDKGNTAACRLYEKMGGKSHYADEIVYIMEFEEQEEQDK